MFEVDKEKRLISSCPCESVLGSYSPVSASFKFLFQIPTFHLWNNRQLDSVCWCYSFMKIRFYAFDSIPSVILSLPVGYLPSYSQALLLNLWTISSLIKSSLDCASTFLSPLPSFFEALLPSLISPVPHCFQGTPNANGSEYFSVFILLFTPPSSLEILYSFDFLDILFNSLTLQPFLCGYFPIYPETWVFVKKLVLGYFMMALHSP